MKAAAAERTSNARAREERNGAAGMAPSGIGTRSGVYTSSGVRTYGERAAAARRIRWQENQNTKCPYRQFNRKTRSVE